MAVGMAKVRGETVTDRNPANWEKTYQTTVAQNGPNSPEAALSLKTLGNLYWAKGDFVKAEARLFKAVSILEKTGSSQLTLLAACRQDLALLYAQTKQYSKIAPQLRQALNEAKVIHRQYFGSTGSEEMKKTFLTLDIGVRMAVPLAAYAMKRKPDSAVALQQLSFDAALYLNGLLADDSRTFNRTLRNRVKTSKDPDLQKLYNKWLAQKQAALNVPDTTQPDESDDSETEQSDALDDSEIEEKLFRQAGLTQLPSTNNISWTQVRDSLKANQAAVSFVSFMVVLPNQLPIAPPTFKKIAWKTDTLYAAMVIRPGYTYPRFVTLGREQQIRQLLAVSQKTPAALYGGSRGLRFGNIDYGDSLYRFVWRPIEKLVQGTDCIYFSTEGLLNQVAFSALPLPGTSANTPVAAQYLSGRYDLHQLFSTRQLAQGIRPFQIDTRTSVALMGGIDYEPAKATKATRKIPATIPEVAIKRNQIPPFPPLSNTKQEVTAIQQMMPGSTLSTARNASEERFRQFSGKAPTILHLATHGLYLSADPTNKRDTVYGEALMRSGLALAGANGLWEAKKRQRSDNDGLLTAYEVADLDLSKTRLVVLSACESALGDVEGAEGVYGLQRGFRIAGAEKMIISLWPVNDEKTRQLMIFFYTNLKAGQEVRTAFRKAQLMLQQEASDPTFWAAFVLIE
jgi:CHAT domain-containing protein